MSKRRTYRFASQVYARLRDEDFRVRLMRSKEVQGLCWIGEGRIALNAKGDILATLVHEMLHDIHPRWTEDQVSHEEARLMQQLSHRQLANIALALGKSLQRAHNHREG